MKTIQAIVLVQQTRCLRCDHRWQDSSLLFRNEDFSYSYDQTEERLRSLEKGELAISGRRFSKRATGACHQCVMGPTVHVWEGKCRFTHEFAEDSSRAAKRSKGKRGPDPQAQALISHLLDI